MLWQSKGQTPPSICGNCDNCQYRPSLHDVTTSSWELLQIVQEITSQLGRIPLSNLMLIKREYILYNIYSSSQQYDIPRKLSIRSIMAFQDYMPLIFNYKPGVLITVLIILYN